jgi:hypothetical protein
VKGKIMAGNRGVHIAIKFVLCGAIACCGTQLLSAQTSGETWKDSATGLTWMSKDNGADVNQGQAKEYCASLRTGGFSDWRLPTIDELENLYDKNAKKAYKAKGTITLSDSCVPSSSLNPSGEVWNFCFSYGGRTLTRAAGHGSAGRALCVRKTE